jgi:hypothetical protein
MELYVGSESGYINCSSGGGNGNEFVVRRFVTIFRKIRNFSFQEGVESSPHLHSLLN